MQFTRADYMAERCTFAQYYDQFVDDELVAEVEEALGDAVRASKDPSFSDISIMAWDRVARTTHSAYGISTHLPIRIVTKLKEAGDMPTAAGAVFIYKAAARRIRRGSTT